MFPSRHGHANSNCPKVCEHSQSYIPMSGNAQDELEAKFYQALGQLVPVSSTHYCAYTPGLSPCSLHGSLPRSGKSNLGVRLALRCFQRLSLPDVATQRMRLSAQLVHQRSVHSGPLVLRACPLKFPTPAVDRDRTGSRRSEPSSRASLIRELRNPWDLVQPQDETSRHRGAKPCRRCERSGKISLLSPG